MTILPLTYLGNIEYYRLLYSGGCVIDLYENYVKQSFRNRCEIMTSGGRASLTVNVVKGGSIHKKTMRDIRIDYSKRWQHQHWLSLLSAYRNSPYFEHYGELFEPFYTQHYEFLADLNIGLMETMFRILGRPEDMIFSKEYVRTSETDTDYRGLLKPSGMPLSDSINAIYNEYYQVFSEKIPFEPNLSIIDLIFCEGPLAVNYVRGNL